MKKILVYVTIILFLYSFTLSLSAKEKKINVLGGIGFSLSDFEGLFIDVGAEMHIKKMLWAQLLIDYYFNPYGGEFSNSAFGINLYGVYKRKLKDKMTAFGKAGVHYTTARVTTEFLGVKASASEGDFGLGFGAGIEYFLKEKLRLLAGATFKLIFGDGTGTWFKIYAGVSYRVK